MVAGILFLTHGARGQASDVRVASEDRDGAVIEVSATWPLSLRAVVDSAAATTLTAASLARISGQLVEAYAPLKLPALVSPVVQVIASDYDEISLPAAAGDSLAAALDRAPVEVVGLGMERKRPAATLLARLLTYDEATGVLRRYRRLLVQVTYRGSASDQGATRLAVAGSRADNPHLAVSRSALADGFVFKIPVTEEGIYKIDRNTLSTLLAGTGLTIDNLDAARIKVYGNGGASLPALNSAPRPADLVENPIWIRKEGNELDVYFYAAAPSGWRYNAVSGEWEHYVHPFSNDNYYFLKFASEAEEGKRVAAVPFPGYTDARQVSQVTGRFFSEPDEVNWSGEGHSGHTWVSKQIGPKERKEIFANRQLPGIAPGEVRYRARVAINSNPEAAVYFESNGVRLAEITAGRTGTHETAPAARAAEKNFVQANPGGGGLTLSMTLQQQSNDPEAALDWVRVFYPQTLRAENGYLRFVTPAGEAGRFDMNMTGFTQEPQVWDVTEPGSIRALAVQRSGEGYRFQVQVEDSAQPRELVAFVASAARLPGQTNRVSPQNLHGIQSYPEFIIVAPDTFQVLAQEFADYRRKQGMSVEVSLVNQIYNEFSGGLPDMRAVRDYFKFLYDRSSGDDPALRYALLFGDGHFDFRGLGEPAELNNWIFPYETEESFDPIASFTSDDYFGLLDDNEGIWPYRGESVESSERVDIGIGRFTVQTRDEASAVMKKIKDYESNDTYGAWRSRYLFVADDSYNGLGGYAENIPDLHVQNSDVVARDVRSTSPEINIQKIYGVSYQRVFLNGWKLPEVRKDILSSLESGLLAFNYSGHGGEDALAQEKIFTQQDAEMLQNYEALPIFITATCSFGRWDMESEQSGAEALLLNSKGGAIALMTTVRTVYTSLGTTSLNVGLNRAVNDALFEREANGLPRRLGDALRIAKNTSAGAQDNNRKFNLLGDPTMRIGLPPQEVKVLTVNDIPVAETQAPIRALDKVTISGEVRFAEGNVDESFNGQVVLTVFDAEREVNFQMPNGRTGTYTVREDLIWRGEVGASNGRFSATFVVPKDISYSNRTGRISAYAQSGELQGLGFTENIVVGGTSANPPNDKKGPEIALFMNDTTFVSGGMTTASPQLLVKLFDESGINTVGAGVGHEMLLVLDNDEQNAVSVSNHYESEADSYQRGKVAYPLTEYLRRQNKEALDPGPHTITVKAWDVLNNSTTATLDFYVSESADLALRNVYNYPNPMVGDTRFIFEHNQPPGTAARVQIRVYTLSGRPVRTIDTEEALPGGVLPGGIVQVLWNGLDEDQDPLATGVYLYKLRVEVDIPDGERSVSEHIEKLAVIR